MILAIEFIMMVNIYENLVMNEYYSFDWDSNCGPNRDKFAMMSALSKTLG